MAISSSLLAKAESDSFLRGIDSTTGGFEADISKGGPTRGYDVYEIGGIGTVLVGRVEAGALKSNPNIDPIKETTSFTTQIIIMDYPSQIINGYAPILGCNFVYHSHPNPPYLSSYPYLHL
ncbi:hypothetical protein CK203_109510 [Vitis vinifera]|uniref:Uncharacterized protein n=1 Tax=Vitis vinifera TaxID=29760 RepID=A0A438EAL1_VITVI|nr:hypothetical protein CK203_109510 [Vitis vinifera]